MLTQVFKMFCNKAKLPAILIFRHEIFHNNHENLILTQEVTLSAWGNDQRKNGTIISDF